MARTTVIFSIDFTDVNNAQVFAQMVTLAAQAGIPMQVGVQASAAPVSGTGKRETADNRIAFDPATVAPATDHEVTLTRLDATHAMFDSFANGALGKARKAYVKSLGFTWDAEYQTGEVYKRATADHAVGDPKKGAWSASADVLATLFDGRDTFSFTVTASEIQAIRDKAAAKAVKKGA